MSDQDHDKPYHLEIYLPGSTQDALVVFFSDNPFLTIQAGDLINPGGWEQAVQVTGLLRVVNVEHIIWTLRNTVKHKVCVFTEETEDTRETRLSRDGV
jgi:hypothetical protein